MQQSIVEAFTLDLRPIVVDSRSIIGVSLALLDVFGHPRLLRPEQAVANEWHLL